MDKEILRNYLTQGLSRKQMAETENTTVIKIDYWLDKYELVKKKIFGGICAVCGKQLEGNQTKFCSLKCKNKAGNLLHQVYERQHERGLKRKLDLICLRGSKCEKCGYSKNLAALQFHHINPEEKESQMDMRKLSNSKWEWCLAELEKCLVLCGNCHAETHHPHLDLEKLVVGAGTAPGGVLDTTSVMSASLALASSRQPF